MGEPKAWLRVGTEHLLQRVVRVVAGVVHPVVVAARPQQDLPALPEGITVVYDALENAGPLAGLAAGFEALADSCEAALVISCDHPLIRAEFIRRLMDLLGDHSGIIPKLDSRLYPLIAIYRLTTRLILADMLDQSEFRVHDFAYRTGARLIPAADLADPNENLDSLRNVNDPADYADILRDAST